MRIHELAGVPQSTLPKVHACTSTHTPNLICLWKRVHHDAHSLSFSQDRRESRRERVPVSRSRTMVYQGAADRLFRYSRPAYAVWTLHDLRSTAYSAYASHQVLETLPIHSRAEHTRRDGKERSKEETASSPSIASSYCQLQHKELLKLAHLPILFNKPLLISSIVTSP